MPLPKSYTSQAEMNRHREAMHARLRAAGSPIITDVYDAAESGEVVKNPRMTRGARNKRSAAGRSQARCRRLKRKPK